MNIRFCTEKRFSDYIVRELTLTATKATITKAANGSDLDVKTTETRTVKHYHYLQVREREKKIFSISRKKVIIYSIVGQETYKDHTLWIIFLFILQWKDFNAPEHAPAMLKFVKRINEDHQRSKSLNPPILGKELVIFYVKITMIYRFFFRENTTDFKKLIFIYLFFSSLFSRRGTFWYFGRHWWLSSAT